MFVNTMCRAERRARCMLNRPGLYQANQRPLRKRENAVRAQTPGTETHSAALSPLLFISLFDHTQLYKDCSWLCMWNHEDQSTALFVSPSNFSSDEKVKAVLILLQKCQVAAGAVDDIRWFLCEARPFFFCSWENH